MDFDKVRLEFCKESPSFCRIVLSQSSLCDSYLNLAYVTLPRYVQWPNPMFQVDHEPFPTLALHLECISHASVRRLLTCKRSNHCQHRLMSRCLQSVRLLIEM